MRLIDNSVSYYTTNPNDIYADLVDMMLDDSVAVDETYKTDLSEWVMYTYIEFDDDTSGIRRVVIQKDNSLYNFHFNVKYHPECDEWY